MLECAQNLACVGAEPLGLTNCLNFGNPEKPTVAWQLDRSTAALAEACEALGVPVVGGNVSLYNETEDGPIYPTPVVGMVGELPDPERAGGLALRDGDAIASGRPVRARPRGLGAGEAAGRAWTGAPEASIAAVADAIATVREAVRAGSRQRRTRHQRRRSGLRASPRWRSPAGLAPRSTSRRAGRGRGASETALFGEGVGGFLVAGERATLEGLSGATVIGSARRRPTAPSRQIDIALADAERAWRSLGDSLEVAYPAV